MGMPKDVRKHITTLEETLTKLEYILDGYATNTDVTITLGEVIDELIDINDELDDQMEE